MYRVPSLLLLIALAYPAVAAAEFHTDLLEKGKAAYHSGQYVQAEKALRIAAFGLLERLEAYETAKIYLALTYDRLGNEERALEACKSLFHAEEVRRTYRDLDIPGTVRNLFEDLLAKLYPDRAPGGTAASLTPDTRRSVEPPSPTTPPDPPAPQPPTAVVVIEEAKQPTVADEAGPEIPRKSVEIDELEALLEQQPDSVPITLALAEANFSEGNLEEARRRAKEVADTQPQNIIARVYLARISHREEKWAEAVEHFLAADRSATLTQDDMASLLTALVAIGRYADARKVATSLNKPAIQRPDVIAGLRTLEENFRPVPPTASGPSAETEPVANNTDTGPATEPAPIEPVTHEDIFALIREARQFESSGRCDEAVEIYRMVGGTPGVERFVSLAAAHGLGVCLRYEDALKAYARVEPLKLGEEQHMFRAAVAFYETGNLAAAREYLKSALREIEVTPEVEKYRARIGRQ